MHEGHHGILDGVKKGTDKGTEHAHAHPHVHSHDGGEPHSHADDGATHSHDHATHSAAASAGRNRWIAIGAVAVLFGALYFLIAGR